jgi:hypothetical protein
MVYNLESSVRVYSPENSDVEFDEKYLDLKDTDVNVEDGKVVLLCINKEYFNDKEKIVCNSFFYSYNYFFLLLLSLV